MEDFDVTDADIDLDIDDDSRTPTAIKFPVFKMKSGDRFVFPSMHSDGINRSFDMLEAHSLAFWMGIECEAEKLEVPVIDGSLQFAHVENEIIHPSLAHGAATILLISGPLFDQVFAKTESDDSSTG